MVKSIFPSLSKSHAHDAGKLADWSMNFIVSGTLPEVLSVENIHSGAMADTCACLTLYIVNSHTFCIESPVVVG